MHKTWNGFYQENDKFYLVEHEELEKAINVFKQKDTLAVLDLGCGSGRHLVTLAENDFLVTGLDYSPSAAHLAEEWLEEKGLQGKVYVSDFRKNLNSFKTDEFDAVVSIESLQYLDDEKELEDILGEINRILKKEGKLFLILPSKHSVILQPSVSQVLFDEDVLKSLLSAYFEINEFYQDQNKSWVIFATNK